MISLILKQMISRVPEKYDVIRKRMSDAKSKILLIEAAISIGFFLLILIFFSGTKPGIPLQFLNWVWSIAGILILVYVGYLWSYNMDKIFLFTSSSKIISATVIEKVVEEDSFSYTFLFYTNQSQERIWKTVDFVADNYADPKYDLKEKVDIVWDSKKRKAELILRHQYFLKLEETMNFNKVNLDPVKQTEVLHCPSCGGNIPLEDNPVVKCHFCSNDVFISEIQRDSYKMSQEILNLNQYVYKTLLQISKFGINRKLYKVIMMLPFLFLSLGILLMFLASVFKGEFANFLFHDTFMTYYYWWPVVFISAISGIMSSRNFYENDPTLLLSIFSARTPDNKENTYNCRNCGSAISTGDIEGFVVCPYCKSDNFISANSKRNKQLEQIDSLSQISAEEVAGIITARRNKGLFVSLSTAAVMVAFYYLVISVSDDFLNLHGNTSHFVVAILASFPLFLLGSMNYAIMRSAFLSPVEDYDWLPDFISEKVKRNTVIKDTIMTEQYKGSFFVFSLIPWMFFIATLILYYISAV